MMSAVRLKHLWWLSLLSLSLNLAACAANPADVRSSTPERVAEVGQICAGTMELNPANADYAMCVSSLLQTLAGMDQAELAARDRRVCNLRGLKAGSSEFALCVVSADEGSSGRFAAMR